MPPMAARSLMLTAIALYPKERQIEFLLKVLLRKRRLKWVSSIRVSVVKTRRQCVDILTTPASSPSPTSVFSPCRFCRGRSPGLHQFSIFRRIPLSPIRERGREPRKLTSEKTKFQPGSRSARRRQNLKGRGLLEWRPSRPANGKSRTLPKPQPEAPKQCSSSPLPNLLSARDSGLAFRGSQRP